MGRRRREVAGWREGGGAGGGAGGRESFTFGVGPGCWDGGKGGRGRRHTGTPKLIEQVTV